MDRLQEEEIQRIQQEILDKERKEKEKIQELKTNIKNWYYSRLIREYIEEYKEKLLDNSLTEDHRKEINDYAEWALKQANDLNSIAMD